MSTVVNSHANSTFADKADLKQKRIGIFNRRLKPKLRSPEEDPRFSYENRKLSKNYHSIKCETTRFRNVFDFNPTIYSGCGFVGLNHNSIFKQSDHIIVSSNHRTTFSAAQNQRIKKQLLLQRGNTKKEDRPFSKNTHRLP